MSWADQVTDESGTLRAHNLGAAVCADGANGLVRPWTVDNVARISEMAEAYTGQAAE